MIGGRAGELQVSALHCTARKHPFPCRAARVPHLLPSEHEWVDALLDVCVVAQVDVDKGGRHMHHSSQLRRREARCQLGKQGGGAAKQVRYRTHVCM